MDTPVEGETEEEADAALERYERELGDVEESLKELDVSMCVGTCVGTCVWTHGAPARMVCSTCH